MRTIGQVLAGLLLITSPVAAQEPPLPPPDRAPILVLAHSGPHAPVTSLAFAPDASTLYACGFDKQIRRYELAKGKFAPTTSLRVPTGPGNAGVLNAVAVSSDGKWVAAAGRAPIRGEVWSGSDDGIGEDIRHLPPLLKRDTGVVYLFDPKNPQGGRVIRGAQSEVRALAFANPAPANGPVLVTVGIEWNEKGEYFGVVRVFDATTGKELASRRDLPPTTVPPGLAAWADNKTLRVGVAWDKGDRKPGKLLVWDNPGTPEAKSEWLDDGVFNSPLAVRIDKTGAKEVISGGYRIKEKSGGLAIRDTSGIDKRIVPLGEQQLPVAVAALRDATAVLVRVRTASELATELWLLDAKNQPQTVRLAGIAENKVPVLSASPDGRYVAVAGFTDNRIEVYDVAAFAKVQTLAGAAGGFGRVAFATGNRIWLGAATDTPATGGLVLDLDRKARTAMPQAAKIDAPPSGAVVKLLPARVEITIGDKKYAIALPAGERATAAAFLPEKPVWDATVGPVVAVAHVHDDSQTVLVTLFSATTSKPLMRLSGPTLPIRSLAFSGTRPLLATAGDDGTVTVWSLKNLTRALPTVEGLLVTQRGGEVIVASVQPGIPLAANDAIEAVGADKGALKPVKTPLEFMLAIRALKVGDNARIKLKGKAAPVIVPVGVAIGFRHPLFTLWVDPVAKNAAHDWIGWTAAGPYDTNGEAAEARIGWITATGDPARPVTFAAANQYRKLYFKRDFLRLLIEKADYNEAIAQIPPPQPPTLLANLMATTFERDGKLITREKPKRLDVFLRDPDAVLDSDRLILRWRAVGQNRAADEWKEESFAGGHAQLDLSKHAWVRGEHRFQVRLFKSGEARATPVDDIAIAVTYIPPAPILTVAIDGKPLAHGAEITTMNKEVTVTATADGATIMLAGVAVTKPVKVTLKPDDRTTLRVTATNSGEGVFTADESHSIEVRVRQIAPKVVPPPTVKLAVLTPHDFRTASDEPFAVTTPKVTVTATVTDANPIAEFEWKIGDGNWEAGKLDAKTFSQTREVLLPAEGKPLNIQIRAKSKESKHATDAVQVVFASLPSISVTMPPMVMTGPDLRLAGGLKVAGKRAFKIRVLVTSSHTGHTREFEPTPDAAFTSWDAAVTLFPGENQIGYAIKYDNDRKESRHAALAEVRYIRPPVAVAAIPVDVGTGTVGDVSLAVLAPADVAPTELWVNGSRVGFRLLPRPIALIGASIWLLKADSISMQSGAELLKSAAVIVRNAEGESLPINVEVRAAPKPLPAPPPVISLFHKQNAISAETPVGPVSEARFAFDLKVNSEKQPTRVEVWHGNAVLEQVDGVNPATVAVPGGFELTAKPGLQLRAGVNRVRVVAATAEASASFEFTVSYTPPAVRVVIDAIREPNGVSIQSSAVMEVAGPMVEVEGRVVWDLDDEPVSRDPNLDVVFIANGVAHLPVRVAPARDGKERKFTARVHLNTLDNKAPGLTRVRVSLRSGGRPAPVPQQGLSQAEFTVASKNPVLKQRLHVVMVGVEVPEAKRPALIREVVEAVGGTLPPGRSDFNQGAFTRPGFDFAYLYAPRLGYTKSGDLNALLIAVKADIERRTKRQGEEWVNDVIVIYYQGEDWVDKDERWLLHTAPTLSGAAGKNPGAHAIRLDDLPQIPGMPVAVVNVASRDQPGRRLSVETPYLRYAWKDADATGQLLPQFIDAVKQQRTVSDVATAVEAGISKSSALLIGKPTSVLSPEVSERAIGLGNQ